MSDKQDSNSPISSLDADMAYLGVLTALIDELKASRAIDPARLAERIKAYSTHTQSEGSVRVLEYFTAVAKRKGG